MKSNSILHRNEKTIRLNSYCLIKGKLQILDLKIARYQSQLNELSITKYSKKQQHFYKQNVMFGLEVVKFFAKNIILALETETNHYGSLLTEEFLQIESSDLLFKRGVTQQGK